MRLRKPTKGWDAEKVVAHCMRNEANSNRPRIHRRRRWRIGVRLRRPKKREGSLVIATSKGFVREVFAQMEMPG